MKNSEKYLEYYNEVSDDVKFVSNSLIRLKVLNALYDKPSNMKELTNLIKIQYSSISTTLHGLELRGMIYRKSNKYYLVNSIKLQMENIIQLTVIINLLEEIFSIVSGHEVNKIPKESILELHLLNNVKLLESDSVNIGTVINFMEDTLTNASTAKCILPIYYEGFNNKLNDLAKKDKFVEILVSENIFEVYEEKSEVNYLSSFYQENNFLLIITNNMMILGFFKEKNIFDTNRILIANDGSALEWANNLFSIFKKLNK